MAITYEEAVGKLKRVDGQPGADQSRPGGRGVDAAGGGTDTAPERRTSRGGR